MSKKISKFEFEEMALANDIKNVTVVRNKELVEVYLKDDALKNEKYVDT